MARGGSMRDWRRATRDLLERVDPDGRHRFDPHADQRRCLHHITDATGMLVGWFALDPAAGAAFTAALDTYSAPIPTVHAPTGEVLAEDDRDPGQRRADALSTLVDMAMGVTHPRRGERPRVVVYTDPDQLTGHSTTAATTGSGDPVDTATLQRLACDAGVQRVLLAEGPAGPLDLGREHRLVTHTQRRALEARDRGCVICGINASWCDAHHVVFWAHGGTSDLDNYALLCPRHHTAVHNGEWTVRHDPDGELEIVPPVHVDPLRRPRRALNRRVADAVRKLHASLARGQTE